MGLLDYYRQFEGMTEEEVNVGLRAEAAERKRKALTRMDTLDLSQTTWSELPHPSIVGAITFVARRGLQRYPHLRGSQLRAELAIRHDVEEGRLILGNGAAKLLSSAARALIEPGQRLLSPWPSYPLYPIMARRAHGHAVPVKGGVDELLREAAEPGTRVIAIASPNDPTGELLPTGELQRLLEGLPDDVAVLLDESLVEFSTLNRSTPRCGCWQSPAPVRVPQLLQGLGSGRAARGLRHRRTRLGGAARRARARSRRLGGLPGRRAGGAAQLHGDRCPARGRDLTRARHRYSRSA